MTRTPVADQRFPLKMVSCGCSFLRVIGRDPLNQNSNRSDREKRTTSKGGPVFSKLFRLDRTDPLSFGPKFPEILVEWIAPKKTGFVRCYLRISLKLSRNICHATSVKIKSSNDELHSKIVSKLTYFSRRKEKELVNDM